MKMQSMVRGRYLRFLLPVLAAFVLLCLLMLLISGFGFRYLFQSPLPLEELKLSDAVSGAYVQVPVEQLKNSFAYLGYQDDDGNAVIFERYMVHVVEGKYLMIRVTEDYVPLVERMESADDLVLSGELGSALELNLGSFTGTLNPADPTALATLRGWLVDAQIDAGTMTDKLTGADLSGYAGAAEGDYAAYLDAVILPLQLESGYLGTHTAKSVKALTVIALLFLLPAILLAVSIFAGLWERPYRAALRQFGRKPLSADYETAALYGPALRVGQQFVWISGVCFTRVFALREVIWAYPRSKRLDGGRLRWSIVLKTTTGEEAAAVLDSESAVEQAIGCIASRGYPLVMGFDKEKQKLYKKDLAAFQGRARNGTL